MALHRQGRYIRSDSPKVDHYAWEQTADRFTLSFWRGEVFTEESVRAGLRIAELAAQYGEGLLFSDSPETHRIWMLLDRLATELGVDPFAAVLASFQAVRLPQRNAGWSA